ncbi:hypothetical protein C1645_833063 [Glomus cerebriforme]|uniref:Uncharacterized protein n=1 Tax=Glomus cerebriforme TaxID=658196 RepID=A0A397SMS8_9GLOM|nr:hypothetical protein C1645_833063 [Glomus cerebriforme]
MFKCKLCGRGDQKLSSPSQISCLENEENRIVMEEKYNSSIIDDEEKNINDDDDNIDDDNESELSKDNESESSIGDIENFHGGNFAAALDDLNSNYKQETIMWPSQTYKDFMTTDGTLMRVYSEQNTAEWWRERESPFSKILAIMLYIDGTTLDAYGRHSEYPIFLTLGDQLNNMHIDENSIILRTHENMCAAVFSHNAKKYSIHEHKNFFWNFTRINIYDATALDRMHLQEIGLFPYMLDFTRDMIMYQFGNDVENKPFINCNKLIQCFMEYIKMYITSRKEKFSEDELNNFEVIIKIIRLFTLFDLTNI